MQRHNFVRAGAFILGLAAALPALANPAPTNEELYQIIRDLQAQLESLKRQIAGRQPAAPGAKQQVLERKVEAQQKQIEALADEAEQARQRKSKTHVGGYGELHYNNLEAKGGVNPSARDREEIDFHRFVLFFGHDFNDRVRFRSELELEHALTRDSGDTDTDTSCTVNDADADGVLEPGEVTCGTPNPRPRGGGTGEVELEQAYVEFDVTDQTRVRGGLFLIPVGILNETHEPPSFYGVERNPVENAIIPTTWWAGGAALVRQWGSGWSADLALHEGLRTSLSNAYAVRSGRQKTSSARAEDLAFTGRLKWTGVPGFEWAATYHYQQDITQSLDPNAGPADLIETHVVWNRGPFGLRALYASWGLDGNGPKLIGADEQKGYYLEPSWRFNDNWGVFARYNVWDNQAGSGGPGTTEKQQTDLGANWWPIQNVVIKADYQLQDNENGQDLEGFNLGIGYQF